MRRGLPTQPDSPHHAEGSGHTEEVPGPANCPFWTLSLLGRCRYGPINRTPPVEETAQNPAPGPKSSPGPSKLHKRDIAQLVADNLEKSNCALARELGVNESTVRRARRVIGVTPEQDIANLNPMGCKWPTGETHDGTLTFCGAQRLVVGAKLYPYCEKHCHAAYPGSTHLTK